MSPDLEHGVLHHILGIGSIADDPQRDGVGTIDVTHHEQTKRRLVAGRHPVEQILVLIEHDVVENRLAIGHGGSRLAPGHLGDFGRRRLLGDIELGGSPDIKRVAHSQISNPQRRRSTSHTASGP